ncbi:Imm49 family immunity protein [Streptomyces sp. NPDC005151]
MAIVVPRHGEAGPNSARWAEALGESQAGSIARLESSPTVIDSAFRTALLHVEARCTVDPQAAKLETWEAVVSAMRVGSALFAVTGATEGTVECRINREMRTLPAIGQRSFADAGNWLTVFWLAIVCRDQKRMTQLCQIPLDRLRSPEGECDEYIYHWVDALQTYWPGGEAGGRDRRVLSRMLIALGTEAAMKGYRVRYTLATKLVNELVEAADEKQLNKTIARYGRVDLLCIDELGYMELDRRGAELLFQVLTEREEKNSVAIASNESFGGWTKTFTDPRLCAAIVDRLTFNGTIIETGTDSYRLASTRARAEEPAKAG